MAKIPLETLIQKIKDNSNLSEKDIRAKIKDKLDLLSGLISEDGAAHIIANELGIKILDDSAKLEIKNIMPGMKSVELSARVVKKYEVRSFDKDGRKGKVGSFLAGDKGGLIRVTAWNDKADILDTLKEGDNVKIENAYSKEGFKDRVELHLGDKAKITITHGEPIEVKEFQAATRKKITELKENEENIEILGTIVQVFDPRFFEVCPQCQKRTKPKDNGFSCDTHGQITPTYSYVFNLLLDDSSDNVRVVLWKNQAQRLLNISDEEMIAKRETGFEDIKNDLLGKIVKFVGKTTKNQMFERIEFVPQLVFASPDPSEEIAKLKTEIKEAEKINPDVKEEVVEEKIILKPKKEKKPAKKDAIDLEEIDDLGDLDSL
jgi:ssDNA-binding replication factor A large subunit